MMGNAAKRGLLRMLNRYVVAPRILSRPERPLAARRKAFEDLVRPPAMPVGTTLTTWDLDGIAADVVTPPGARGTLLYFHGGGYHLGSPRTHRGLALGLALESRATVVLPKYRLAPEHPFPAATDDAAHAYAALRGQLGTGAPIVFGGDSAGGNLALCATIAATRAGIAPAGTILLSPWTDLTNSGASVRGLARRDPVLTAATLAVSADLYLAGHETADPRCSPLFADLTGLPPVLIQVGADEILLDDARRLAAAAEAAGVSVSFEEWPRMWHVFQMLHERLNEADAAVAALGCFVRARLDDDLEKKGG